MPHFNLLDTVATVKPIPRDRLSLVESDDPALQHLPIGQVGTILEIYDADHPRYLIEFADLQGREYAMAILQGDEILALHYDLQIAS